MITRLILVTALALVSAGTADASEIQLYNNRATWNTDRTGVNADLTFTNMTFETFSGSFNTAAGLLDAVTNVQFAGFQSNGISYDLEILSPGFSGSRVLNQLGSNGTITVTLPANVRAFGVDLSSVGPFGLTVAFNASSAFSHLATTGTGASGFFGVRTDAPITSLVFSTGVFSRGSLDNFEIGAQAETPEVATLLAIGTGLIAMRWMRRRRSPKLA
jgi:hypothetical protein